MAVRPAPPAGDDLVRCGDGPGTLPRHREARRAAGPHDADSPRRGAKDQMPTIAILLQSELALLLARSTFARNE
jgi:hypothetical protein